MSWATDVFLSYAEIDCILINAEIDCILIRAFVGRLQNYWVLYNKTTIYK